MSLRPLKLLYTGVWASGYMRRKDIFVRVSIKDISLVVHVDNSFKLSVDTVHSEDSELEGFALTGEAQVLYESNGEVDEILLSNLCYNDSALEQATIFSISRRKCTRLPIPSGEAFFCFSSRLPPINFSFQREEAEQPMMIEGLDNESQEMSFDELFEAFSEPDLPVDIDSGYRSS